MFFFDRLCIKLPKNKIPLQVHSHIHITYREKRTSLSASNRGSMTVEASIILPILLCAFMGIILFGKIFVLSVEMDSALVETARQIARKEYLFLTQGEEGAGVYLTGILFSNLKEQGDICDGLDIVFIDFSNSGYEDGTGEVHLVVKYTVKIPMLLLGTWRMSLKSEVKQKAWNGYRSLYAEGIDGDKEYVYVAEDGEVYHRDGQCYHLHVTIKEVVDVTPYYDGATAFRPCEYCVSSEKEREQLYITEEGECYHEDISCGALTRRVHVIELSQIEGRRECKVCCQ